MSTTLHRIFQNKALVLARTMVIKSHIRAMIINDGLRKRGYEVDDNAPLTWKYYLNLFGVYHQSDHDQLLAMSDGQHQFMRIKVAGDNRPQEVDFTKELLHGNTSDIAIANEYRFNTNYYNSLVTRYPDFETLILGVLNPVSPTISIDANEGEILYCGGYLKQGIPFNRYHMVRQDYGPLTENFLIEMNEENLIPHLQREIYAFLESSYNAAYNRTNDLYFATLLALMMKNVMEWIEIYRFGNFKTPFVHSYHIRCYLDSFGQLGWVTDHIKKSTAYWLYMNQAWLDANRGKNMVFQAIVDNVLSPENIPISGHYLKLDLEDFGKDGKYLAKPYMERDTINFTHTGSGSDYREILDIVEKEEPLAVENHYDIEGRSERIGKAMSLSMFDKLNTKVLESTVIDLTNHMPVTLEDVGMSFWCFAASHGYYRGTILVTHPLNNERLQLTPLNAYILCLYCLNKGWADYDLVTIPDMSARLIPRIDGFKPYPDALGVPTLDDMLYGTSSENITMNEIIEIMGSFKPTYGHNSSVSFNEEIIKQHNELMRKYYAYCRVEDSQGRAQGEWVGNHFYWNDVPCKLAKTETKFSDWLLLHGIELEGFNRTDYVTLGLRLVEAATGIDLEASVKLKNKQNAVLSILRHFSSYTIQIIQGVVAVDSYMVANKMLRVTNDKATMKSHEFVPIPDVSFDHHISLHEGVIPINYGTCDDLFVRESYREKVRVEDNLEFKNFKAKEVIRLRIGQVGINDIEHEDIEYDPIPKVPGDVTTTKHDQKHTGDVTSAMKHRKPTEGVVISGAIEGDFVITAQDVHVQERVRAAVTVDKVDLHAPSTADEALYLGIQLSDMQIVKD